MKMSPVRWERVSSVLGLFGQGETTLSWGETNLSWRETTWGETTLSWGEKTIIPLQYINRLTNLLFQFINTVTPELVKYALRLDMLNYLAD